MRTWKLNTSFCETNSNRNPRSVLNISSLLCGKHLRHQYILTIIISLISSPSLIHLVHSSLSQPLPWNSKLKFCFSLLIKDINDISTNCAPQNICDAFTCSSDVHTCYNRFYDAGNLYVNKSRLRIRPNSFSIFGAK